jgi:predicted Rossmann fold nucleotide-binding protein DprA/Smf involved in DNA uptake
MRVKQYGMRRQGSLVSAGPVTVNRRIGPRATVRRDDHKRNLATLLSAGDATTSDLAAVLEMTVGYVQRMLEELELEGRVESRKVKAARVWSLA